MNRLLVRLLIFFTYKLDCKKVLIIIVITTILGLVVQTRVLPFPISPQNLSNPIATRSNKHPVVQVQSNLGKANKSKPQRNVPSITIKTSNASANANAMKDPTKSVSRRRKRRRRRKKPKVYDYVTITLPPPPPLLPPPPPPPPPTPFQRYIWSLPPDEALLYAKKELQHAPSFANDTELYGPIFRNVSRFKRSYELMELILKVFIYPEGERPIFHTPSLTGIYASEGWFMKLMEENRRFVTRSPEKAHLFYLPYSSRQLQQKLYVVGSHNLQPLSIFIRDYINMLSSSYPFWNRSRGSDHFLAACHDWGPYTLKEHKELVQNSIKALCNADLSEGFFKLGRDVSLPETTIRRPERPLRNVGGGIRVSQRPILAFFAGGLHGRVRPILLKHWRDKHEDMRIYERLPEQISKKMDYIQHMRSSRYCICPMGYEVNSPRIVEAIYYECVPVIIADNFVPPLDDVLDWSAFSLTLAEKDIPRLREVLLALPLRKYLRLLFNLKMLQRHFLWNPRPVKYDLFHMILHSIWLSRLGQVRVSQLEEPSIEV